MMHAGFNLEKPIYTDSQASHNTGLDRNMMSTVLYRLETLIVQNYAVFVHVPCFRSLA